ncbi:integrase family protein [Pseudomonas fluorescens Q2-87]|uniref:Integrase family protein n=1 Tax=Pseudomonas fluorescens (strain Q2-87) TaxID=1038922 RepID=J2ED74_PSEFQ|nr:integrase family protein [Pseudomonas fluorescens Q2-87]
MGTITSRKGKDNSTACTAQIRINRDGATVYQESQASDCKQVAQAWIKRRETELAEPGGIERANRKGVTINKMIEQYLNEYEKIRQLGKTKNATLKAIKDTWLGELDDSALTSQKLVEFAQWRIGKEGGSVQAQTLATICRIWVRCCPWLGPLGAMRSIRWPCRMRARCYASWAW